MTKYEQILEHVVVTFFEAAVPYLAVHNADLSTQTKVVLIGAAGMGLSAVYNLLRQSSPTIPKVTPVSSEIQSVPPAEQPLPTPGETVSPEDTILDNLANESEDPALITPPDTSPTV